MIAFIGGAVYYWLTLRKPHQKSKVYTRVQLAKLRAKCRRQLRSYSGKSNRGYRRGVQKLLRQAKGVGQ